MSAFSFVLLLIVAVFTSTNALVPSITSRKISTRGTVLYENFGFDFSEDASINTPKRIFGEVNLKNFVEDYDPDALLLGGPKYNIIQRIRELRLLTATADSGLLEALEAKGLTLAQVERLLPLIDDFNLLPLLIKNKDLVLAAAPLLIEPAPALLPVIAGVLKTSSAAFLVPGVVLLATGGYEAVLDNNALLGGVEAFLGLPLVALGFVLSNTIDLPAVSSSSSSSFSSSSPSSSSSNPFGSSSRPTVKASGSQSSQSQNGRRKVLRVN